MVIVSLKMIGYNKRMCLKHLRLSPKWKAFALKLNPAIPGKTSDARNNFTVILLDRQNLISYIKKEKASLGKPVVILQCKNISLT